MSTPRFIHKDGTENNLSEQDKPVQTLQEKNMLLDFMLLNTTDEFLLCWWVEQNNQCFRFIKGKKETFKPQESKKDKQMLGQLQNHFVIYLRALITILTY